MPTARFSVSVAAMDGVPSSAASKKDDKDIPGATETQLKQDVADCKELAQVPLNLRTCVWGGPWFVALPMLAGCGTMWAVSAAKVTTETDPGRMWACMEARGYEGARPARPPP